MSTDNKIIYQDKPLTIKRAKELCKAQFKRLPRPGYESRIIKDTIQVQGLYSRFSYVTSTVERNVYLQNNGGRFRIWEWISPVEYRGVFTSD